MSTKGNRRSQADRVAESFVNGDLQGRAGPFATATVTSPERIDSVPIPAQMRMH
jgi:hypothetical protein